MPFLSFAPAYLDPLHGDACCAPKFEEFSNPYLSLNFHPSPVNSKHREKTATTVPSITALSKMEQWVLTVKAGLVVQVSGYPMFSTVACPPPFAFWERSQEKRPLPFPLSSLCLQYVCPHSAFCTHFPLWHISPASFD